MQAILRASRMTQTMQRNSVSLFSTLRQGAPHRRTVAPCSNATRRVVRMSSAAKFFVGGNWKCNGSRASVKQLVSDLNAGTVPPDVDVVCAPPFVFLEQVADSLDRRFQLAAQNCWTGKSGAFTGEISAEMLTDTEIPWVILGHSERRALCGESNEVVGEKVAYAQGQKVSVIACIGETLKQREDGQMFDILDGQMSAIAEKVIDWNRIVIAYEPVWAIGTGVVATPDQAQEIHAYLRKWMAERVGDDVSNTLRIIYGGSVNDTNCVELAGQPDIDGFLVGGASLKGPSFINICNSQQAAVQA